MIGLKNKIENFIILLQITRYLVYYFLGVGNYLQKIFDSSFFCSFQKFLSHKIFPLSTEAVVFLTTKHTRLQKY